MPNEIKLSDISLKDFLICLKNEIQTTAKKDKRGTSVIVLTCLYNSLVDIYNQMKKVN